MARTPRIFDLIALNNAAVVAMKAHAVLDVELTKVMDAEVNSRVQLAAKTKRERRANRNFKLKANGGIR